MLFASIRQQRSNYCGVVDQMSAVTVVLLLLLPWQARVSAALNAAACQPVVIDGLLTSSTRDDVFGDCVMPLRSWRSARLK